MSFFIYIDDKDKSMDFYKILLSRIEDLPVGTIFTIGQAYRTDWPAVPAKDKIAIARKFKTEVEAGRIQGIRYYGLLPGRVHAHKQYKKEE